MKKDFSIRVFLVVFFTVMFQQMLAVSKNDNQLVLSDKIQPITEENIFRDPEYFNWCSSIIKGKDGRYHLFYSRWNRKKTFAAWLTHSTVAHAVSDRPDGPYKYVNTVLDFEQNEYKKGNMITAHNPKIKYFNGKYYLYFISTKLNHDISNKELLEIGKIAWHMNNKDRKYLREQQRTYVAVSDDLDGKWTIRKKSLLEPGVEPEGPIVTLVTNPAITQGPDKRFYLIVKGDKPNTIKFLRNEALAVSNYPDRGFKLQPQPIIEDWDTEDVSMWYDKISARFYAVFHAHTYIGMMTSKNGIDWEKADDFTVSKKQIERVSGQSPILPGRMERPFVFVENGQPRVLSIAVGVGNDAYIVMIPLKNPEKEL